MKEKEREREWRERTVEKTKVWCLEERREKREERRGFEVL